MPKFDVTVHYHGVITYVVDADNAEQAIFIARQHYADGVRSDCPTGDWERVEEVNYSELPDERNEQPADPKPDSTQV
jgi:hypothetical protein